MENLKRTITANENYISKKLIVKKEVSILHKIKKATYYTFKRTFDIIFAIMGLVLMIPAAIIIKIIYMYSGDFESIFYKHIRIGKNGKEFELYKFRSMVKDSNKILEEMLKKPEYKKEWAENQKFENDPRITKVGKFIRKTSIDELPQFWNIIKNEMSLIGPRPLVPGELKLHNGNADIYEKVKPGITSWWASHGRSSISYEERLNLEYFYIKNMSISMDIKCVFATIKAILMKTGAK